MLLAILAQAAPDDYLKILDQWWAYLALALPLLQSVFVKANAGRWFKIALSLGFAAALSILSLAQQDWSAVTVDIVMLRLGFAWTVGQLVYKITSAKLGGIDGSLNDVILPKFGISIGQARKAIETTATEMRSKLD